MASRDKENTTIFSGFFHGTAAALLGVVVALIGIPVAFINVAPDLLKEIREWIEWIDPSSSVAGVRTPSEPAPHPSDTARYQSTLYPSNFVQQVTEECVASGGTYIICKCQIEEFQRRYTWQELQQKIANDSSGFLLEASAIGQSCQSLRRW
ncbi:MAG: hypothetical protein KME16_26105 [Scytolyngbya sp. HA4215-MV1]|nr:hypothetical protein [Scytolyngbya sp. HA4215-MV1]